MTIRPRLLAGRTPPHEHGHSYRAPHDDRCKDNLLVVAAANGKPGECSPLLNVHHRLDLYSILLACRMNTVTIQDIFHWSILLVNKIPTCSIVTPWHVHRDPLHNDERSFYLEPLTGAIERMWTIPFASIRADAVTPVACSTIGLPSAPQKAVKNRGASSFPGASTVTESEGGGRSSIDKGIEFTETTNV